MSFLFPSPDARVTSMSLSCCWSRRSDREPPVVLHKTPRQLLHPFLTPGVGGTAGAPLPASHQGSPWAAQPHHWSLCRDGKEPRALPIARHGDGLWAPLDQQGWADGGCIPQQTWLGSPFCYSVGGLKDINMFFSKAVNLSLAVLAAWVTWKRLLKGTR